MSGPLTKAYTQGTHRCVPPEQTLARIAPHLGTIGVTRCADVTGLDRIGIPVCCAIRPRGRAIQVSNGKGLSPADARVSALMEALEVAHAESGGPWRRGSLASLRSDSLAAVEPALLPNFRAEGFFSPDFLCDWVAAEELVSAREVWLPASAAYLSPPMLCKFDSNGLASGNHLVEATLHALYEVIERDALSRLSVAGRLRLTPRCRGIDLDTVDDGPVRGLCELLRRAEVKLVLIWVPGCVPIHTFWAALLDANPLGHASLVSVGYGTHLSVSVAATRAITEAVQSRLTGIHGAREDLPALAYQPTPAYGRLFAFFEGVESKTPWRAFEDLAGDDLLSDYGYLLNQLPPAGYDAIFRINLTRPPCDVPVVKVLVPGLADNERLF